MLAVNVAKDINLQFSSIWDNIRLFARQLEASADRLLLQAQAMLEVRRSSLLTYRALYLVDGSGRVLIHLADPFHSLMDIQEIAEIVNRPPVPLGDEIAAAYMAVKGGNSFLSPANIVGPDQVPIIYIAMPVLAEDGSPSQILVAEIDLRSIWQRIDEVRIGQTGQAFVVSREGVIIAHPIRKYIGQPLASELRPLLDGYEGRTRYVDAVSDRIMLASYSPAGKQAGWGVVVEQEQSEAFAPIKRIFITTLAVLLIAVAMVAVITIFIARTITYPIEVLVKVTRKIARTGDLSHDVAAAGQDEVGQLATSFNQMIAGLRQAEQRFHSLNQELEQRVARRTAELQAANNELRDFAYAVSHDLKAPLLAITQLAGWIEQGYSDRIDAEGKEQLSLLGSRAKRMDRLINGILEYSRVGRVGVKSEHVDLNELVKDVAETIAPPENFRITVENDLPVIFGERVRMEQVFQNLIDNAVKFMDKPRGEIRIRCTEEQSLWRFSVADNGPGIDKKYHEKIFKIFQTLTARDELESTGIGLTLVKKIVEGHGGSVWVESARGKGSTFSFTLPREEATDEGK